MSSAPDTVDIVYPETDGKPMGETDTHRRSMAHIHDVLEYRYRGQRVYVGCDLLLYYEQGNPKRFVVPDNFVVFDCEPGDRRIWQTWAEGRSPDAAIEVTSRATWRIDLRKKPKIYAQIGVKELLLYDPLAEWLSPPLKGFRLSPSGGYEPIEPDATGALESQTLGILFRLEGGRLAMFDARTGEQLRTEAEAALRRAEAAEEEVRRLRAELKRRNGGDD